MNASQPYQSDTDPLVREFEELIASLTSQVAREAVRPELGAVKRAIQETGAALDQVRHVVDQGAVVLNRLAERVENLGNETTFLKSTVERLNSDVVSRVTSGHRSLQEQVEELHRSVETLASTVHAVKRWVIVATLLTWALFLIATGLVSGFVR